VFEAQWNKVINGGALNFTMDFNGHNFRHAVHDLCHILQIMHRFDPGVTPCPVPAQPGGFKFKSAPIFVPPTVPVGVYAAHLEVADDTGDTFLCVNYDLSISA
jgi:hypothetical protein